MLGNRGPSLAIAELTERLAEAESDRVAADLTSEMLRESFAEIESMLSREDAGWQRLGPSDDMTVAGRARARALAQYMAAANPLIKRGLTMRVAYVWGLGVSISAKANGAKGGQDVNGVLQAWLEDNRATFTGSAARARLEWALGTDGEVCILNRAHRVTGAVTTTTFPCSELDDVMTDPDNARRPWYYLRTYQARTVRDDGSAVEMITRVAYPAVGYRRKTHPASIRMRSAVYAVQPDAYVKHVVVNPPGTSLRGLGDAFAALAWARAYKEFLEQWATLMKALARYAWKKKAPRGRVTDAATDAANAAGRGSGQTHVSTSDYDLEAIPKTGATIDADSGRPIAAMVAAGMGIPVTILLGDPGVTGARAVAETLTEPTGLEMGMRRDLWAEVIDELGQHVIDEAVIAPLGELRGPQRLVDGMVVVTLLDESDRTIDVSFPGYSSTPVELLVKAITDLATALPEFPRLELIRKAAEALGFNDIDEMLEDATDEEGRVIPADTNAGDVAADQFRRGLDPAAVV